LVEVEVVPSPKFQEREVMLFCASVELSVKVGGQAAGGEAEVGDRGGVARAGGVAAGQLAPEKVE
jgi:hypothetical protein